MENNLELKMIRVHHALETGRCQNVEFSECGHYVRFLITEVEGIRSWNTQIGFKIEIGLQLLRGFRFKQHEYKRCF